jgi:ssDNA-binding Zn-finger/Zn-ribbon topoisomerase 1
MIEKIEKNIFIIEEQKIMDYSCPNCRKIYKLQTNYEKHHNSYRTLYNHLECSVLPDGYKPNEISHFQCSDEKMDKVFSSESKGTSGNVEDDNIHPIHSSQKDIYRIIRELGKKCDKMQKEIDRLKNKDSRNTKRIIVDWLNKPENKPLYSIKPSEIDISEKVSSTLFEDDLYSALKQLFCDWIEYVKQKDYKLPVCAFTQKSNVLYLYNTKSLLWEIFSNETFLSLIREMKLKILQKYLSWKMENEKIIVGNIKIDIFDMNEDEWNQDEKNIRQKLSEFTDKCMLYSRRIFSVNDERIANELYKWLYSKIECNLNSYYYE